MTKRPLDQVADYYSQKVREHGATPRGVDWNGEESQSLRFQQLLRVTEDAGAGFSLNEIGCGYGAMIDYVDAHFEDVEFHGVDLSADMIEAAETRYRSRPKTSFVTGDTPDAPRMFSVASGIFNVRLETPDDEWLDLIHSVLDMMNAHSTHGFAFNALTKYSDAPKMRDYLYYADPLALFDRCKRLFGRNVALLHDYGLYEFTILVRKYRD